jgi:hypothetical protein
MIAADLIREIESGPAADRLEYLDDQLTSALDGGPDVRALVLEALEAKRPDCGWSAALALADRFKVESKVARHPHPFDGNGFYVSGWGGYGARGRCYAHAILSVIARSRLLSAV